MKNEPDDLDKFIDSGLDRLSRGELSQPPKPKSKTGANGGGSQPGFRMSAKGLMWSDPSDQDKPEIVISGSFEAVAECRDDSGSSWGRLLRWKDSDGRAHEWAMPISLLAGDGLDVRRALLDGGLYVSASPKARNLLTNYLASVHVPARARAVTTTGWFAQAFVFPDGAIGGAPGDEHVILQTPHFVDHSYNIKGTLEDWQTNVAKYAEGNSRLSLAISTAFAAALVGPCGAESGGIHLRGKSSVQHIQDGAISATGSTSNPAREGATIHVLPENINDYNDLEDKVAQVAPVAPKNDSTLLQTESAEAFLAAIQTIWPEARMLTPEEQAEDAQFREQLILLRAKNAEVYATPTPWKSK